MNRTGFKPRTKPMARQSMRRGPSKNSKPGENIPLRTQYLEDHQRCLLCSEGSEVVHHIRRGIHRHDVVANLAALCHGCHAKVHSSESVFAEKTIEILYRKHLLKEFDPAALDRIGTPLIAGWLDQHRPGACGAELLVQWLRLTDECERC